MAHKWTDGLHHAYLSKRPQRFRALDKISSGRQVRTWATSRVLFGGLTNVSEQGTKSAWITCGLIGYITPTIWGVPNPSKRGKKSEVVHKKAHWLQQPSHHGGPQRFRVQNKISSSRQVGRWATSRVPSGGGGLPTLHGGAQNQQYMTCGRIGYITPAI